MSRLADQSRANERGLVAAAADARAERELLEQALENTGTGLRVLDPGLRPFLVNDQWRLWFPAGSAAESAILAWASAPVSPLRRTLGDSSVQRGELTVSEPAAPVRSFAVTTAPLHDSSGRRDRVVELVQDVTAEKKGRQRMLRRPSSRPSARSRASWPTRSTTRRRS